MHKNTILGCLLAVFALLLSGAGCAVVPVPPIDVYPPDYAYNGGVIVYPDYPDYIYPYYWRGWYYYPYWSGTAWYYYQYSQPLSYWRGPALRRHGPPPRFWHHRGGRLGHSAPPAGRFMRSGNRGGPGHSPGVHRGFPQSHRGKPGPVIHGDTHQGPGGHGRSGQAIIHRRGSGPGSGSQIHHGSGAGRTSPGRFRGSSRGGYGGGHGGKKRPPH